MINYIYRRHMIRAHSILTEFHFLFLPPNMVLIVWYRLMLTVQRNGFVLLITMSCYPVRQLQNQLFSLTTMAIFT